MQADEEECDLLSLELSTIEICSNFGHLLTKMHQGQFSVGATQF